MKLLENPAFRLTLAVLGALGGLATIIQHLLVTDFPVDMIIYREGVKAFLDGRSVYAEPMMAGDLKLPFIYPPFGALFMVPLTIFSGITDSMAGDIMIVISDLAILACLFGIFRAVTKRSDIWWAILPVWALALNFEPVRLNDGFAQINIVVMALVVADLVPRKRFLPQGWLLGVAAAIKITPLAILLYFLVRKEWKPILTAAASAVIATLLAAAVRWQVFVEFFSTKLLQMGSGGDFGVGTDYQSNSSLKAVIQRLFTSKEAAETHGTLINILWLAAALLTIVLGALLIRRLFHRGWDTEAWMTAAVVMLLISPVSWSHHWVWLALIIPVLIYRACETRTWLSGGLMAVLVAWAAMLLTVPPKWWFGDQIDVYDMPFFQKFLVDDFVWLAVIAFTLFALCFARTQSPTISRSAAK